MTAVSARSELASPAVRTGANTVGVMALDRAPRPRTVSAASR